MKRFALVVAPAAVLLVLSAGPAAAQPHPNPRAVQNPSCESVLTHNPNAGPAGPNAGTRGNLNFFQVGLAFGCITEP